jgi:hypothetical protein
MQCSTDAEQHRCSALQHTALGFSSVALMQDIAGQDCCSTQFSECGFGGLGLLGSSSSKTPFKSGWMRPRETRASDGWRLEAQLDARRISRLCGRRNLFIKLYVYVYCACAPFAYTHAHCGFPTKNFVRCPTHAVRVQQTRPRPCLRTFRRSVGTHTADTAAAVSRSRQLG